MSTANDRQVGGDHYRGAAVQHWDLVLMFGWDYFQGQIIKYVMRHDKKHGRPDLEKAAHFLEKYLESRYPVAAETRAEPTWALDVETDDDRVARMRDALERGCVVEVCGVRVVQAGTQGDPARKDLAVFAEDLAALPSRAADTALDPLPTSALQATTLAMDHLSRVLAALAARAGSARQGASEPDWARAREEAMLAARNVLDVLRFAGTA